MSRIQNILDKAEREGASFRTSRVAAATTAPSATTAAVAEPVPVNVAPPVPASLPPEAVIVPGPPTAATTMAGAAHAYPVSPATQPELAEHFTVRLNPLLIAGLSPKSPAAEQYRGLRTRLSQVE